MYSVLHRLKSDTGGKPSAWGPGGGGPGAGIDNLIKTNLEAFKGQG